MTISYLCISNWQKRIRNYNQSTRKNYKWKLKVRQSWVWQCVTTMTSHPSLVTPTRVYSQSRPHPNSPWPNLNPSQAFPIHLQHSRSGEYHSRTHLTIPDEPETSWIPSTNPELARSPLNPKTQYTQPRSGEAWTPSYIPDWVLFLFFCTYYYPSLLTLVSFLLSFLSSVNPVSV